MREHALHVSPHLDRVFHHRYTGGGGNRGVVRVIVMGGDFNQEQRKGTKGGGDSRRKGFKGKWICGYADTWTFKREASASEMCEFPRPPGPNGFNVSSARWCIGSSTYPAPCIVLVSLNLKSKLSERKEQTGVL